MRFISVGLSSMVDADRVVAIKGPDSAPMKRIMTEALSRGALIDATYGHRTRSVIVTDSGYVILSVLRPSRVARRITSQSLDGSDDNDKDDASP